jgi:hypothetical protein
MRDKEKPLPEDYPDSAHMGAAKPDDFGFFNPATLGSYGKVKVLEVEVARQKAINEQLRKDSYSEESDDQILDRWKYEKASEVRDWMYADEGFEHLANETEKHLTQQHPIKDPEDAARDAYLAPQRRRLQEEQNRFYPPDDEE